MRRAASWALALAAAVALAAGALLTYAEHTVFRSGAFADRAAASLEEPAVRAAVARRLGDVAIGAKPDLVAIRPIVEAAARGVVSTAAFRSLLRRAVHDAHRSAFNGEADAVTLRVRDAGLLLAAGVRRFRPDLAERFPVRVPAGVARVAGGFNGFLLSLAQRAERARVAIPIAFGLALVLALAAVVVTRSARLAALRLGAAVAVVGAVVALASSLGPRAVAANAGGADREAVRAAVAVWLDPLTAWAVAAAAAGLVVALAAAAVLRPLPVAALARRAGTAVTTPPRTARGQAARVAGAMLLGVVMIAWPRAVLGAAVVAAGALLVLAALSELLRLAGAGAGAGAPARPRRARPAPALRVAVVAAVAVIGALAAGALAADAGPDAPRTGRCNGHAALCDRPLDEVAFLGTHNSMAADREPGWLFPAQEAGIPQQLQDGVRSLLVDTHYGFRTPRGVATDLSGPTKSRAKLVDEVGETFVRTAERARARIGRPDPATRDVWLCHAFCEVGATRAVDAFAAVHRFLVTHPEEVLVLSIEDDTDPADTARVIRDSGLIGEVYRGAAARPWPTLRELIVRDERVVVLVENRVGTEPWMHRQPAVMQETPYRFRTEQALEAPGSCAPNRGGTAGSLLLVNHWVDTSPAPRKTIARRVNAGDVLGRRLARCRATRRMLPNVAAVDFYREGDALRTVDELNGVR